MLGLDMNSMILLYAAIGGGWLAWQIMKPKPNAIVLERIGDNFYLSKAFHDEHYLQHRKATYPIPSTYDYWILLGRGFVKFRPKWMRFFYIENSVLSRIEEAKAGPAVDQEIVNRFIRSQTLAQLLRSLTIPKTTLLLNLLAGAVMGIILGIFLAGWMT